MAAENAPEKMPFVPVMIDCTDSDEDGAGAGFGILGLPLAPGMATTPSDLDADAKPAKP
jgi:hypothetical protein